MESGSNKINVNWHADTTVCTNLMERERETEREIKEAEKR